jgi:hypothetical protein
VRLGLLRTLRMLPSVRGLQGFEEQWYLRSERFGSAGDNFGPCQRRKCGRQWGESR